MATFLIACVAVDVLQGRKNRIKLGQKHITPIGVICFSLGGILPYMTVKGCAAGQGMVFDLCILNRVYTEFPVSLP